MDETAPTDNPHYVLVDSPRAEERSLVLKHGDAFAVFDRFGDIEPVGLGEEGLYYAGTRFLNHLVLSINGRSPLLLTSAVRQDNAILTVDLTNADIRQNGQARLPRDSVHIRRSSFLNDGILCTRLYLRNYWREAVAIQLDISFDADFVDIFEVRGERRARRGRRLPVRRGHDWVQLAYAGLDNVSRSTRLEFSPAPQELSDKRARFQFTIEPRGDWEQLLTVICNCHDTPQVCVPVTPAGFDNTGSVSLEAAGAARLSGAAQGTDSPASCDRFQQTFRRHLQSITRHRAGDATITTSNPQFNDWLSRSAADLHMMVSDTAHGPYPYAGIPWFSTPFGRDGIITALEFLWVNPALARGVLQYLAATQADTSNSQRDAEPGKILHEARRGEMPALGEVPFGQYYGTVDATPLFIVLAGAYYQRTGDRVFIESIWPNVQRAIGWIEQHGDCDGDGFVEYSRQSPTGLVTQGWKDSFDSIFHADGALAQGPIALCEVQGYVYAGWQAAAKLAQVLGHDRHSRDLSTRAARLARAFDASFWCEDIGMYALALDGEKRPCRVRASNAGHCLFSGIATESHGRTTGQTLLDESFYTGWGVRTVASTEARYNPMAYHNGSVWPHDNALISCGLSRYGVDHGATRLLSGLFDASHWFDLRRMPELFCGFSRRTDEGPTFYSLACSPQAWAAGSVFMLIQASLGLSIDAIARTVRFDRPALPESVAHLSITNLRVGDSTLDLAVERNPRSGTSVTVVRRQGEASVVET